MEPLTRKSLRQYLETEQAFGVEEVARPRPVRPPAISVTTPGKEATLEKLRQQYQNCLQCELHTTRTQVVFGSGSPHARLMFIGEAPGLDEDKQGQPFVGAAGQLLTKIIEAMKLSREEVYIANCLKCRPPGNRNPLPEEIAACSPILTEQIRIIQPEIICALGKFAAQTLLATDAPISRLRGKFHDFNGIKLMPTFHPAYLLRNPDDKKLVWEDMKQILQALETREA